MKRPKLNPSGVADKYAGAGERIAEVTFPSGRGCLVSLRTLPDGTDVIDVYRADQGITLLGIKEKVR